MLASLFLATLAVGHVSGTNAGSYVLEDDYSPSQFFSMFDFFTASDSDPTHGYVQYVDQTTAQKGGLINTNNNAIYMGVDSQNVASGSGRQSVRLVSKKTYTHGLIILDLAHMPGGICGTWPAFWTVGPHWPGAGEIDIIEGVNSQVGNSMTLHTASGCSASNNGQFTGSISTSNCDTNAPNQPGNAGCAILNSNGGSYGNGFNQGQGGVYATEWTSDHIDIWFFPRGAIPQDMSSSNPNPSTWGHPTASFGTSSGCDIDRFFQNHQIVFDTTFCGDWAGNVWNSDPVCSSKAPTCNDFVQNNPSAFKDAYWSVNSLKVFQASGANAPAGSGAPVPPFSAASVPGGVPTNQPIPTASVDIGNGWHTKTFGHFAANVAMYSSADTRTASPTASPVGYLAADPSVAVTPPMAAVVVFPIDDTDDSQPPTSSSAPEPTPFTLYQPNTDDSAPIDPSTFFSSSEDGFPPHHPHHHPFFPPQKHRRDFAAVTSPAELPASIEPRSTTDLELSLVGEAFKRRLDAHAHEGHHRHAHRMMRRAGTRE